MFHSWMGLRWNSPPPPLFAQMTLTFSFYSLLSVLPLVLWGTRPRIASSICSIIVSDVLTSPVNNSIYGFILQKSNTYVNQYNGSVNSRNRFIIKQDHKARSIFRQWFCGKRWENKNTLVGFHNSKLNLGMEVIFLAFWKYFLISGIHSLT